MQTLPTDVLLRPVRERDVVAAIQAQLVELIRSGAIATGDALPPERRLAERLDVSRASLRSAISSLVDAGLLEPAEGRSGARLRTSLVPIELWPATTLPAGDELFALLEARRAVEPALALLAASRASDADLDGLSVIIDAQRRYGADRARAVLAEGQFHRTLWRLAANAPLEGAMRAVYLRLEPVLDMAMRTPEDTKASLTVHEMTLKALRSGDDAQVGEAMDEHLGLMERIYEDVAGRSFARRSPLAGERR